MSIPIIEIIINTDAKIYLKSFLIAFLLVTDEKKMNGIATALPNKNDSGLIKKLVT